MQEDVVHYSVESPVTTRVKIKRSEFVCALAPVETLAKAKEFISRISKENKTATHNCWAYVVGDHGQLFHSSDAGEPSGTAGKPMLNALQHHCLTNVAAVVTRYYGGVKLGVRGLMDAYFASVDESVSAASLKPCIQVVHVSIEVAYEFNDILLSQLDSHQVIVRDTSYTQKVCHSLEVDERQWGEILALLDRHQSRKLLVYTVAGSI